MAVDAGAAGDATERDPLASLITALPVALVGLDRDDLVTHWNPAAERIFGWTAEEVLGRPYPACPPGHLEEHRMILQDAFKGGRGFAGIETRRLRKDGSIVDVAIWAAPLPDPAGPSRVSIAVILDLTERKKLEDQLYQAQKMEAVGRLAGGIAHDFNNLITVVTGQSSLLLEEEGLSEEVRGSVGEIADAADKAALLTRQLLAFGRRQVLQPRVISMNGVLSDMGAILQRLIGADVAIESELDSALGHARIDPVQFQQVVMNLVVNARDAMPGGGRLRIRTSNARIGTELASRFPYTVRTGDYVLLEVSDTGAGMEESVRSQIFEPFFTTKSDSQGTGLGLSTVYGIVKQSGGYIWVDSAPGEGATFRLYFPRVEADRYEAAEAAEAGQDEAPVVVGATILLAEDEVAVRWLARRILERAGYRVLEAEDGDAALRVARDHPGDIDLFLSDVVMPGRRGPEAYGGLAASRPGLPAIFMSGYSQEALSQQTLNLPGVQFLPKPFTPAGLRAAVARALGHDTAGGRAGPPDERTLERALRTLEAGQGVRPRSEAMARAGELCVEAGQRERALRYFGRAVDAYLEAGEEEEAERICHRILAIAPSVVRARHTLALLAMGRGDTEAAVARVGEYVRAAMEARQAEVAIRQLRTMVSISREPELQEFLVAELAQLAGGAAGIDPESVSTAAEPPDADGASFRERILRAALAPPSDLLH
jgi:two-component system, cell cycle sensor histidine kinase and response regulator CckA